MEDGSKGGRERRGFGNQGARRGEGCGIVTKLIRVGRLMLMLVCETLIFRQPARSSVGSHEESMQAGRRGDGGGTGREGAGRVHDDQKTTSRSLATFSDSRFSDCTHAKG